MLSGVQSMWDGHLGQVRIAKCRIELTDECIQPTHSAPHPVEPESRKFEKAEIHKMLLQRLIDSAQTEWVAPTVFAPKKDGLLRFCVDYGKLRATIRRSSYPIRRIAECFGFLGEAAPFFTGVAISEFCQVEGKKQALNKTAFTFHHGLYTLLRVPFELETAPGKFQRAMTFLLSPVKGQCVLMYLANIVVFLRSPRDHISYLKRILSL